MAKNNSRLNIHEALNRRSYDHAVICSFTFEAPFFEEYCLEKLTTLSNNGNITVFIDKGIYEQAILGSESLRPQKANLRYLLYPISVPGVFHTKLFLLAGKEKGKLIIGSANFTRSGITANAEIAGFYEYETGKNEESKILFQQAFKYIQSLAAAYPSENLDSNISALIREADWLLPETEDGNEEQILLHNLEEPLWEQLIAGVETPVESISVLSRFFDDVPTLLDKIENDLKPKEILIYTQNGITNLKPTWLQHPLVKSGKAKIFICNYADEGYPQPLHAKAIAIQNNDKCCLAFGSANFSTPALLRTARSGNAEILIKLSDLSPQEFQPKDFFDPNNTAVLLKDDSVLRNSKNDEDEIINERINYQIRLLEATFKDSDTDPHISINARVQPDTGNLHAKLTFGNQITKTLNIFGNQSGLYYVSIPSEIKRLLNENSTVIHIEMPVGKVESNSILITNVKDIKTDKPVRRERNIKEAQQSAGQFFAVLRELIAASDDEALLTFLNYCDIPFNGFAKPRFQGIARSVWTGADEGMKKLGERNLKIYTDLHPSAVAFFDKHFKKLQKHIESPYIGGIDNFLHIFLAMGGILRSQVERAVIGIEAKGAALTTEEWSCCRDYVDIYYGKFKELTDCLWKKYLSKLIKENDQTKISELFLPDFQALDDLYDGILSYRERVESLRVTKLTRTNHSGQVITPGYFHCVFESKKWDKYSSDINADFSQIRRSVQLPL
jgi:PLD-like domain